MEGGGTAGATASGGSTADAAGGCRGAAGVSTFGGTVTLGAAAKPDGGRRRSPSPSARSRSAVAGGQSSPFRPDAAGSERDGHGQNDRNRAPRHQPHNADRATIVSRGMERDYYEVLGIQRTRIQGRSDTRARVRACSIHVSGDPESEARFRELSEAYTVLQARGETALRRARLAREGRELSRGRRAPTTRTNGGSSRISRASSSRRRAVGPNGNRRGSSRRSELDAYEAHLGATRRVELGEERPCDTCEGSGRQGGRAP